MENKIQYIIRLTKNASIKKMTSQIEQAHLRSGRGKVYIFFDMLFSFLHYGAGYYDYVIFEFWNLTSAQRDTYLTRLRSKKLIMLVNKTEYSHIFDNKDEFNKVFKDYIRRDFIDLLTASDKELKNFFLSHKEIFAKMRDLSCGLGCEKINTENFASFDDFKEYIKNKGFATLEEVVKNHPDIDKIYPFSVNTLRIITLIDSKGVPHCIYAVFKMGNNGRVVDNYGLHGPVDTENGEFLFPAHSGDTTKNEHYLEHPYSHVKLIGMKVPFVKEAVNLALKAALVVPQIRYIGWDIAITSEGPLIIEGNNYCAHDFWQLPGQTPNNVGIIPVIKELVPEFKY